MIIPVRCFTCGKARGHLGLPRLGLCSYQELNAFGAERLRNSTHSSRPQVIGNKWESYLSLLQADYPERYEGGSTRLPCA